MEIPIAPGRVLFGNSWYSQQSSSPERQEGPLPSKRAKRVSEGSSRDVSMQQSPSNPCQLPRPFWYASMQNPEKKFFVPEKEGALLLRRQLLRSPSFLPVISNRPRESSPAPRGGGMSKTPRWAARAMSSPRKAAKPPLVRQTQVAGTGQDRLPAEAAGHAPARLFRRRRRAAGLVGDDPEDLQQKDVVLAGPSRSPSRQSQRKRYFSRSANFTKPKP